MATPGVEEVLAELEPAIVRYAKRHLQNEWEDAAQEARIGVCKAYERFNIAAGVPAPAFCWRRAKGAMQDHGRKHLWNGRPDTASLDEYAFLDVGHEERGLDVAEARADLAHIATFCTDTEKEVLALRAADLTQKQIGEIRGTTVSAVCLVLQSVARRVKSGEITGIPRQRHSSKH